LSTTAARSFSSAGDGAGGAESAEQRRDNVGDTLCNQFLIGVVPVVDHIVGDGSRQK
jgi:hypothetical protein